MSDRTVHGRFGIWEIVRYDRAGKWWIEEPSGERHRTTVVHAANLARRGEAYLGLPGGAAFDRRVRSAA